MTQVLRFSSSGPPLFVDDNSIFQPGDDVFREEYRNATRRKRLRKFGVNPDIDIASAEDIWGAGGLYSGWLTTPERLFVQSTSPLDTANGSGARSIVLEPHDPDFVWRDEDPIVLPTNGVNPSALTDETFIRCVRASVGATGAYANGSTTGTNAGDITVFTQSGIVVAFLRAGAGVTQMSQFTVPAGYALWLQDLHMSVNDQAPADFRLYFRENADIVAAPFAPRIELITFDGVAGVSDITLQYKVRIPPKTDMWLNATAGTNDSTCAAEYLALLLELV